MPDSSNLDDKYFIDEHVYNCPFCKRNNVVYTLEMADTFDWALDKKCYVYIVKCSSCDHRSMHLSFSELRSANMCPEGNVRNYISKFKSNIDIDSNVFYSAPTSSFTLDNNIPRILRDLIWEADGCLKMNYLTGASACVNSGLKMTHL